MERNVKPTRCHDEFRQLVLDSGFESVNVFASHIGVTRQSLNNNTSGRYGLSVERCIKIANGLQRPVDEVIKVFYPELYESNLQYQ